MADDPAALEAMKKKVPQSVGQCFAALWRVHHDGFGLALPLDWRSLSTPTGGRFEHVGSTDFYKYFLGGDIGMPRPASIAWRRSILTGGDEIWIATTNSVGSIIGYWLEVPDPVFQAPQWNVQHINPVDSPGGGYNTDRLDWDDLTWSAKGYTLNPLGTPTNYWGTDIVPGMVVRASGEVDVVFWNFPFGSLAFFSLPLGSNQWLYDLVGYPDQ
jgi:hypothetical protein